MGATLSMISARVIPRMPFNPSVGDIRMTLAYMTLNSVTAVEPQVKLPVEIALIILNFAHYWTKEITSNNYHIVVRASSDGGALDTLACTSTDIKGEGRVAAVRIRTDSRDQGWSSYPAYHHTRQFSSSYFTVALLRPKPVKGMPTSASMTSISSVSSLTSVISKTSSLANHLIGIDGVKSPMVVPIEYVPVRMSDEVGDDGRVFLHYNIHAARDFREEVKVFERVSDNDLSSNYRTNSSQSTSVSSFFSDGSDDDSISKSLADSVLESSKEKIKRREERFINSVRKGDIICVYACAKYAGWINEVRGVSITVDIAAC